MKRSITSYIIILVSAIFYYNYIGRSIGYSSYTEPLRHITASVLLIVGATKGSILRVIKYRTTHIVIAYHIYILVSAYAHGNISALNQFYDFNFVLVYFITALIPLLLNNTLSVVWLMSIGYVYILIQAGYMQHYIPYLRTLEIPYTHMHGAYHSITALASLSLIFIGLTYMRFKKAMVIGTVIVILSYFTLVVAAARTVLMASLVYFVPMVKNVSKAVIVLILLAVAGMITHSVINTDTARERYYSLYYTVSPNTRYLNYEDSNVSFRRDHVGYLFSAWMKQPIFGNGYGTWQSILSEHTHILGDGLTAHSGWLLTLAELGIVGVYFVYRITKSCVGKAMRRDSSNNSMLIIAKYASYAIIANYISWIANDGIRRADIYILWGICVGYLIKSKEDGQGNQTQAIDRDRNCP